jgi:hypothetical protein
VTRSQDEDRLVSLLRRCCLTRREQRVPVANLREFGDWVINCAQRLCGR